MSVRGASLLPLFLFVGACGESKSREEAPPASPATVAATTTTSSAESFPMQTWMKANASTAISAHDNARIQEVFGRIIEIGPTNDSDFSNWKSMASTGADAAKRNDLEGVRAACKGCHDAYRAPYKAKLRTRSLPRTGT